METILNNITCLWIFYNKQKDFKYFQENLSVRLCSSNQISTYIFVKETLFIYLTILQYHVRMTKDAVIKTIIHFFWSTMSEAV